MPSSPSPALPTLTPGAVVAERYRVEGPLGKGGMGVVVRAVNVVTGKAVALKWLPADQTHDAVSMRRLVREARIAARLRHPNVVDVYDVGEHDGALFLVMELLEGEPLSARLRDGPVDPQPLLALLLPVLEGLAAAHRAGVIHRDLKPSNIFLCVDDRGQPLGPKLLDFGISKLQEAAGTTAELTLTATGAIIGTPQYMAPEQFDEARDVDARADVYAMGVLLYRALGGELPYRADNISTLVLRISEGRHQPLSALRPDLPAGLADLVERAMAVDPAARFQDTEGLARALAPFASPAPTPAPQPVARRGLWPLVGLLVVVALGAAWRLATDDMPAVAPGPASAAEPPAAALAREGAPIGAAPAPPPVMKAVAATGADAGVHPAGPSAAPPAGPSAAPEPPTAPKAATRRAAHPRPKDRKPARAPRVVAPPVPTSPPPAHPLDLNPDEF